MHAVLLFEFYSRPFPFKAQIYQNLVSLISSLDTADRSGSGGYVLTRHSAKLSSLSGFVGHSFIPASLMLADGHYHLFDSRGPSCVQGSNTPQPLSHSAPPSSLHPSLHHSLTHPVSAQSEDASE